MSSIGVKIDHLQKLREQKRALEEQIKEIAEEMENVEFELLKQMDAEGLGKASGHLATVSVSESVKPSVEDWEAFYAYIHRMKYYHLLERRPSVTGCRELLETKGKIPGIVPFTQRKLNLRTIN